LVVTFKPGKEMEERVQHLANLKMAAQAQAQAAQAPQINKPAAAV
jgi:hypothetical protein